MRGAVSELVVLVVVGLAAGCGTVPPPVTGDAGADAPPPMRYQSCIGLPKNCGPSGNDDCCSPATTIPGGMFYRNQDATTPDTNYPATVSSFVLDKYEVTVGRFRQFVNAGGGTQPSAPAAGAGAHPKLANSGWNPTWNTSLPSATSVLTTAVKCSNDHQTWTDTPGANETLPINCITWFEAMAFCIWDGGYLPTLAESDFAAAGGSESRAYPWSPSSSPGSTTIDCSYANYQLSAGIHCENGMTGAANRVGNESPKGDGKWGHSDLAGNVDEWVLDWNKFPPVVPCDDCANLEPGTDRGINGGNFKGSEGNLMVSNGAAGDPKMRWFGFTGVRCARTP